MMSIHIRSFAARIVFLTAMTAAASAVDAAPAAAVLQNQTVAANDNQRPAGTLDRGTLTLSLRAGRGTWRPEGPAGPALSIEAFGEMSAPLMVPAPLIRVTEGTSIAASVRNDLDAPLMVYGLCARDGAPCLPLAVPPGESRTARFNSGAAGTYHYWATTLGAPVLIHELAGAFIVDPPGGAAVADRLFVITEWNDLTPEQLMRVISAEDSGEAFVKLQPRVAFMLNGLSWPATERLTYQRGEKVHWRVLNLTSQAHPMHLHGFYFEVDSLGDGLRDRAVDAQDRHPVVTQLLQPGTTMAMTWTPERVGNWLFHCHIMHHVSPERRLSRSGQPDGEHHASHDNHDNHDNHGSHDTAGGMAGMILGVTVVEPAARPQSDPEPGALAVRKLTLVMARGPAGRAPSLGFELSGDGIPPSPAQGRLTTPGPTLVLRRNEPVEITVVNRLGERTALHWHGIELDSFYDGVHGWSGIDRQLAPMIEPDGTFVVRFAPPRAGTFMYHTHLHDERQLPLGLYGPIVVIDSGETFDPATDHVLIIGRSGIDPAAPDVLIPTAPVVLNGDPAPRFVWKAGQRHRVRLINITPNDIFTVNLQTSQGGVTWTPMTKDGAPLPASARAPQPARQTIAVGETYDFELDAAPGRQNLWIEVRSTGGKWQAQGQVMVR